MGKYFSINNKKITGYYSRTYTSAIKASKFTNSKAYQDLKTLIEDSDTIFITTSDDSIYDVWQSINNYNLDGKILCHTSGSLSSKIFSDINKSNSFGYSIHPMFPFSDKNNTYKELNKAYFSIEGDTKYLNYLKTFFESLGNKVILLNSDKKSLYHLANVTVSNLVLALLNLGCHYLEDCGISSDDSLNALLPLIENNVCNLKNKGFTEALTGPIERCDIGTIKKHLSVIPKRQALLYKDLSLILLSLAKKKHCEKNYSILEEYLGGLK